MWGFVSRFVPWETLQQDLWERQIPCSFVCTPHCGVSYLLPYQALAEHSGGPRAIWGPEPCPVPGGPHSEAEPGPHSRPPAVVDTWTGKEHGDHSGTWEQFPEKIARDPSVPHVSTQALSPGRVSQRQRGIGSPGELSWFSDSLMNLDFPTPSFSWGRYEYFSHLLGVRDYGASLASSRPLPRARGPLGYCRCQHNLRMPPPQPRLLSEEAKPSSATCMQPPYLRLCVCVRCRSQNPCLCLPSCSHPRACLPCPLKPRKAAFVCTSRGSAWQFACGSWPARSCTWRGHLPTAFGSCLSAQCPGQAHGPQGTPMDRPS